MPRQTTSAAKPPAPAPTPLPLKEWKIGDEADTNLVHVTCANDKIPIRGIIKDIQPCPRTKVPMHKVSGFWFEAWELLLPSK